MLTYHVLPGRHSAADIEAASREEMNGKAEYKTVEGGPSLLRKGRRRGDWTPRANTAKVTIADVNQSNGVIHVVDTVLMPN